MHRYTVVIAVAAAVVGGALGAGLAASGAAAPMVLPAAQAGGIVQESPGRLWTVGPDGDVVYYWVAGGGDATVTRYDWNTGQALSRRVLMPLREPGAEKATPLDPDDAKELFVSGVIWSGKAEERVAIINGQIAREGELVTGRSGKLYRVLKIHQDREVQFEEQKPEGGDKK